MCVNDKHKEEMTSRLDLKGAVRMAEIRALQKERITSAKTQRDKVFNILRK